MQLNGDGFLDAWEFKAALQTLGVGGEQGKCVLWFWGFGVQMVVPGYSFVCVM